VHDEEKRPEGGGGGGGNSNGKGGNTQDALNFKFVKEWHVEIPWYKTALKGKTEFTVFTLRVYYGEVKWTVDRRFSDCLKFSEDLHRRYEGVPEFPSRQPKFLHDPKFLQTRQRELELYFQKLDQAAYATEEMRNFLSAFTELKKLGITDLRPESRRLQEIVPDTIYCTTTSLPMVNGLLLPVRMTVIKLRKIHAETGVPEILLYSPVRYDNALHMELEELGRVSYILAPNKVHNTFLPEYIEKFPEATLYVAPGLNERVPEIDKGIILRNQPEEAWEPEVDQILTSGNSFFSEAILFHKATKVLIVADLIVNFPPGYFDAQPNSDGLAALATQFFVEAPDKPMCSPEHTIYCTAVKPFEASCNRILSWDFQCLIMSHGTILDDPQKAQEAFKHATDSVVAKVNDRWSITNTVFSLFGSKKIKK